MINRIRDYTKKEPSKDAHRILIICEGNDTEPRYFDFFKGLSPRLDVIPIPSEDGKTDPIKLKEWAIDNLIDDPKEDFDYCQGDTVWFVVDTDEWEKQGKIKTLRGFCHLQNEAFKNKYDECKSYDAWLVAQSKPCFEIWEYYHVFEAKPDSKEVEAYSTFKEYVNALIKGGFDFAKMPVEIINAIKNAKENFSLDEDGSLSLYATEVFRLAEEILPFVKRDIDRMRNKMQ